MRNLTCLSLDEQKQLLAGIESSLALEENLDTMIIRVPTDPSVRASLLYKDWTEASKGKKLNHWARNLVSIKTEEEFLLDAKLDALRSTIREYPKAYTDFSRRLFLPSIAEAIHSVYHLSYPMIKPFQVLFQNIENLQKLVKYLIERHLEHPKSSLIQLISVQEMKDIFFQSESRQDLISEIRKRLEGYLQSLKEAEFLAAAQEILPLYGFRNLLLFPYDDLFRLFKKNLQFEPAPIYPTLDYLERFFCCLYPFRNYDLQNLLPSEIVEFLAKHVETEGEFSFREQGEQVVLETIRNICQATASLCKKVLKEVPFVELIRYYRSDPYYRILIYPPKPKLQAFYTYSLTLKVFSDFEDFFSKIRFDILEDILNQLFKGEPLVEFQYYMNSRLNLTPKQGYPGFTHHRSLVVLYNFLRSVYTGYLQGTIHILNRSITNRVRDSVSMILVHASGIEELQTRISLFDASFAPDAEAGRNMIFMKMVLERDAKQQRAYRALIAEKDKEGKELLEKSLIHLESLLIGFRNIQSDKVFVRETARRFPSIEARIENCVTYLILGTKAIRYLIAMEKGAL